MGRRSAATDQRIRAIARQFTGEAETARIVNVWESQEASDKFEEKLIPARRKAGLPDVIPPQKLFPVHRLAK